MAKQLHTVLSYIQANDLPADWQLVSVGDLLQDSQYGMNCPSATDGTVSIVGMRDIQDGRVLSRNLARTKISPDELQTFRLRRGDLLFNRTNSLDQVGKVGLVDEDREDVFASYLVRLTVNRKVVEPEFLNYWLNSNLAQRTIKRIATPAIGQVNVNPTELQKYCLVPLPPPAYRKAILDILGTFDASIQSSEALTAEKRKVFAWIRAELLTGTRRLPGFSGDWHSEQLSQHLVEHKLKSTGAEEVFSVSVHKGLVNQIEHLGRSFAAKDTSRYNRVKPGDIIYTKSPTGQFPLGIIKRSAAKNEVIVSPLYAVFEAKRQNIAHLLDALFESPIHTQNYLAPLVQKGAKNTLAITNKRFLEGRVFLPASPAEQSALVEVILAAKHEIECLERQTELLRAQRKAVIERLLTAKLILKNRASWPVGLSHESEAADAS